MFNMANLEAEYTNILSVQNLGLLWLLGTEFVMLTTKILIPIRSH